MKLLHTADIHLDSKLSRHLDSERAKQRRDELLISFRNMVDYAAKEGVKGILIAGDLFDVNKISATARNAVLSAVEDNPEITFFYLKGNHDADGFLYEYMEKKGKAPENLKLFSDTWTSYELSDDDGVSVVITGAELTDENSENLVSSLSLDEGRINVVMLHGQETETASKKDAQTIPIRSYRNRGIDYFALGHIHAPKEVKLDARGVYVYPGCLEGRGFDECGDHGFYLLTIEKTSDASAKIGTEFISFAKRRLYELRIDISSCQNSEEVIKLAWENAIDAGITQMDMVRFVLVGETGLDTEFDLTYITNALEDKHYFIKVKDQSKPKVDYDGFAHDISLKGEFVRLIKSKMEEGELSKEEAAEIIRAGISLLSTGEVSA